MNNNENNNLDMNQPMNEKEYYVKKLEKYEELNEREWNNFAAGAVMAVCATAFVCYGIMSQDSNGFVGFGLEFGSILVIANAIAEKAGLESRINEIKEKLELLELQNKQNFDETNNFNNYEEEKGRSL